MMSAISLATESAVPTSSGSPLLKVAIASRMERPAAGFVVLKNLLMAVSRDIFREWLIEIVRIEIDIDHFGKVRQPFFDVRLNVCQPTFGVVLCLAHVFAHNRGERKHNLMRQGLDLVNHVLSNVIAVGLHLLRRLYLRDDSLGMFCRELSSTGETHPPVQ